MFPASAACLAADTTLEFDAQTARKTIERVASSFASQADREQFLYAQTHEELSTHHAYESAFDRLINNCLRDFEWSASSTFDRTLWAEKVIFRYPLKERSNFEEYHHSVIFAFWREWHQAFLDGEPLDWDLQRRIAVIDGEAWDRGPDVIAAKIEDIRARWEVEKALSELSDSLHSQTSKRHGIGGNNPPESIQDELFSGAVTLIWEAEEELSTALEQEHPDREWIEAILVKFRYGLAGFLKWCVGKGDLAVDTLIKWGIPAAGAGYAAKYPKRIEALIDAIERWLQFLS